MPRYLLDANHLGALLDDGGQLRVRLREVFKSGNRVGTRVLVICGLEVGLHQTARRDHNRRILSTLMREVRTWPIEVAIAPIYAEIHQRLKAKGRALSQVDLLLAALATHFDAVLLTSDRDFEALPELRVENWRAPAA